MIQEMRDRIIRALEDFEQFTIDVVFERKTGRFVRLYGGLLNTLSKVFRVVVQIRLFLYERRIFRDHSLGCLVVVVGNLTVGGTGKTPVVEKFARALSERGRKVAILSRGYKSRNEPLLLRCWQMITHGEPRPPKVVSDGSEIRLDAIHAGDEPYMLARNLPGIAVVVDKNRVKAGWYAIREFGVDTLILDDGYQYLSLKGRLNLLLIDKTNPFGNGHLLPRGVLREPIKHLSRASYIFLTRSNGRPDEKLNSLIEQHNSDAEIIECRHQPKFLRAIDGGGRCELSELKGRRVGAFSGIAVPESFEEFLRKCGAEIVANRRFLDHHQYTIRELDRLFRRFERAGVDIAVTTEKDAVRLSKTFEPCVPIPVYYLRMEIEIISGAKDFEEAVSRICFPKRKMRSTRPPFPDDLSRSETIGDGGR